MSSSRKETILILVLLSSMILSCLPTGILTPVASVGPMGNRQLTLGVTANGTLNSANPSDYYQLSLLPGYYNITVRPSPALRTQLTVSRWDMSTTGPTTNTVTGIFAYPSGSVSPATGVKASLVLTVIPPYYDYVVLVSRLSATSGAYNITVTKVSDVQPLTSLPATFSQTLKAGYEAVCKFDVTGPYIYNFTLTWGSSSNDIRAYAYQIGDQAQMVEVRSGVTNSAKVIGVFYPFPAYPVPTYVVVQGFTVGSSGETFTLAISASSSRGSININGAASTTDNITVGQSFYYALQLPLGHYYNFYLSPPAATNLNLYLHSPQTGNPGNGLTRGALESAAGGSGVKENITNVVMFEQYAFGKGPNNRMQSRYSFTATPNGIPGVSPYRVMLEVQCASGTGGIFNLTATSTPFDTYTPGTTGSLVLNATANEQKYYALSESIGNVYYWNATWGLRTSIGGGNRVGIQANMFVPAIESPIQQLVSLHTALAALNGFVQTQQLVDFMSGTYGAVNFAATTDNAGFNRTTAFDWPCYRDGARYIGFAVAEVTAGGLPTSVDKSNFNITFRANAVPPTPLSTSTPVSDMISVNSWRTYSMDLEGGKTYKVSLRSGGITPYMFVIDQNGMIAADGEIQLLGTPTVVTEPQANNEYCSLVEVGASARYYLMVNCQGPYEGNYVVSLQDVSFAPLVGNAVLFIGSIAIAGVVMLIVGYFLGTKNVFARKRGR